MIRSDVDIKHGLAHLEIGEPAVVATVGERRFSDKSLYNFFSALRTGHGNVLTEYSTDLAGVIGEDEHDELDRFGIFGTFAGRMAVRESGFTTVESVLHGSNDIGLQTALQSSLTQAVEVLRAS